jgi:hypothetical protein
MLDDSDLVTQCPQVTPLSADGAAYVAGYLAHCERTEHPDLGTQVKATESPTDANFWLLHLSLGGCKGLRMPSAKWMATFNDLEALFGSIDGKGLRKGAGVVAELRDQAQKKFPSLPQSLVKKWARTRVFIRIRRLNDNTIAERVKKRADKKAKKQWVKSAKPS